MKKVLIDADAYIAIYVNTDSHHQKAMETLEKYFNKEVNWFTTYDVVDEVATKLSYNSGKSLALKFLTSLKNSPTKILFHDDLSSNGAEETFKEIKSKNVSLTDCSNIYFYKENSIDYIFSFDKIYSRHGLEYLK